MRSKGQWRRKTNYVLTVLVVGAMLTGMVGLVLLGYRMNWTGFNAQASQPAKTLWDWMQLLIIPLVIAFGGVLYNRAHDKTEREIASDKQREDILQAYLDTMAALLLEKDLGKRKKDSDESIGFPIVQDVARVRTLTALRRLDAERKGTVLRFLYQSHLLSLPYISLHLDDADLREINLSGAYLSGIHLCGADLSKANLNKAYLAGADLRETNLSKANLREANLYKAELGRLPRKIEPDAEKWYGAYLYKADLRRARLREADLEYANLSETDLRDADLRGANLHKANLHRAKLQGVLLDDADLSEATITSEQLSTVKSCKNIVQ